MGNVGKPGATLAPEKSVALEGDGNTQTQGQDAGRLDTVAGLRERWICRQDLGRGGPEVASPARTSRTSQVSTYKSIHFRRLPTVSGPAYGRDLHQPLKVSSRYSDWLSGPCPRHVTGRARQSAGRHISSRGRDVGQQRMAHDVVTRSPSAISAGAAARYPGGRARRDPRGWHLEE